MADYASIWSKLKDTPDIKPGYPSISLSNEEEWLLWLSWETKGQVATCEALGHGKDYLRKNFLRLKKQNGPLGPQPEYMK